MAAPELRLNVTLDLAFFRTQLQKLTAIAQGEFRPKLFVRLEVDKKDFEQQLKALERIKPVITIQDSQVEAARTRIGTLNKSLATLRRATATPIEIKVKYVEQGKPSTGAISKSGTFRQRLTGLDTEPIKQLYAAAGKAGIVQFDAEIAKNKGKIITALNQAGESSVTGLLNGLKSKDSAVKTAAKSLGDILIAALKLSLQIQSPSRKMEAIGEYAGEGFNKGLKESLSEAKDSAVSKMRELVAALKFEAAKIQNISLAPASLRGAPRGGRGYLGPIGPLPEGSKEPWAQTSRGYQPYMGGPGAGPSAPPRGFLSPASAIGRGSRGQSFAGAPVNFSMGAFPQLPPSGTANQLRQQARVAQAHLRSAERSVAVFGERAAMLDKAMSAFRTSGRATGYTSPIGPLPRDSAEPYAAGSRGMFGKEGFEARLESRPIAGLLSPSSTPTREQIVAMREKIARQRSDARALDMQLEDRLRPTVPPRQYFQPNTQPLLPGSGGALARSSAIVPYGALALQGGGGGLPPGGGGGGAPPVPPSGGGTGGGSFGGMQFNMPQLPGAGIVQELGNEFAFAAKQVLLFGAAYKALAFITDFPSQVGAAVGQLQSFRNTLKSITPSTAEFGQSSQFILSLVDQYNIPLQSARDGFAKLYASMEPAGFSGKEIRDLFEGVSMGAATFGMSADKVDRVMYAFAQMASKGQIMSEELKGQLGDVLPGSLALFAKAAKMSVSDFSKAMEDGAFKGNAMRELLIKVGSTMKEEFGKGAIGAAATFQGVMNRLQTSTTLFYEAFEPAAVAFANTFVLPLTNGLRIVTDAFTQLLTGQKAITSSGASLAAQIQPLIPTFQGIANNLVKVGQAALTVAKSITPIIQLILQLLASPIVGWLAQMYASVVLLQGAFVLLGGRAILGAITGLAQYSIGAARAAIVSQTMASQALSAQMQLRLLASGAATTGVAMSTFAVAVRTAFITTAAGAVVIAVGMMIAEFMRLRGVMDDIEGRYKSVADQARMMGESGNVGGIQRLQNNAIQQANTYEKILKGLEKAQDRSFGQKKFFAIDKDTADLLKRAGQGSTLVGKNIIKGADIENIRKAIDLNRKNYKENQKIIDEQERKAERKEKELKAGGPGKNIKDSESDKDKTNLESYYNLQDQLAKASTQADIDRINAIFEHRKSLINSTYDLEEARANSIQKEAIAHQKAISSIFLELQKKQIDARLDVLKAQGSVAGGATGATTGGATGGATGAGIIEYISGDPSRADYRPDHGTIKNYHDHIAFATRELAIAAYKKLTAADIKVTEFQGFGAGVTGPHSGPGSLHHKGLAMDIPGYQHGGSGPIGPKEYAGSARVRAILGIGGAGGGTAGAGAPRKVPGSEKRDILADQSVAIAQQRESLTLIHAQKEAQVALNLAKETYLAQIFGIAEKELQLGQLQKQTALLKAGATDQEIEDEMKLEEIRLKHTAGINEASKAIASNNALKAQGLINQEELNERNAYQNDLIDKFNKRLPQSIKLQQDLNKGGREYAFTGRIKALKDEIQLLTTVGDAERRLLELRQGGLTPEKAQQVYNLEKVKKNLEDTKGLIGNFVSNTSTDYKGFLKAVISGEDAVDALQKFQEGLTDKVLTIFLDFAMAPVEDMMKKSLEGLFLPKTDTSKVQANVAVDANTTATTANTLAIEALTAAKGAGIVPGAAPGAAPGQGGVPIEVIPFGSQSTLPAFDFSATDSIFGGLQDQIKASLDSVSLSFTDAAFNLNTSAEPWKQTLITDIPFALSSSNEQIATQGTSFSEGLTNVVGGIGAAAAGITGIFAGISQIGKGGTSNVLGGIGSILMGAGGAIGGFGKIFGFADGGIPPMNKPSLVGERGPELFVPHSMGTIIPAGPTAGIREAMANGNGQSNASPVLNMSFETSTINGVEYVSRDQLETAMMETRRQASRDGAKRGMTMTLDRLQQSPSTRSRIGLG